MGRATYYQSGLKDAEKSRMRETIGEKETQLPGVKGADEPSQERSSSPYKRVYKVVDPKPNEIGPLKLEVLPPRQNSSMFKTPSRVQLNQHAEDKMKQTPGCNKYFVKHDLVQRQEFGGGIRMGSEKKDTAQNMIKISPCIGSLNPRYYEKQYQSNHELLHKIRAIDDIERKFNLDVYLPK